MFCLRSILTNDVGPFYGRGPTSGIGRGSAQAGCALFFAGERAALWHAWHTTQRNMLAKLALACSAFLLPLMLVDVLATTQGGSPKRVPDDVAALLSRPFACCVALVLANCLGSSDGTRKSRVNAACGQCIVGVFCFTGVIQKVLIAKGHHIRFRLPIGNTYLAVDGGVLTRSAPANFVASTVASTLLAFASDRVLGQLFWTPSSRAPSPASSPRPHAIKLKPS